MTRARWFSLLLASALGCSSPAGPPRVAEDSPPRTLVEGAEADLASLVGKELTLGIRPEDIHDPDTMGRDVEAVEIDAQVEVVEPMGNEVLLYLSTRKSSFVARVVPVDLPVVEQRVRLAVEIDKAHFFDPEAEVSLLRRS